MTKQEKQELLPIPLSVRPDSVTPLYLQVKETLSSWIQSGLDSGALAPGDRIPSENALSEMLGVSTITIRRALDELRRQGLIHRIQGRGSFVTGQQRLILSLERLFSLTTYALEEGMRPSRRMVELTKTTPPPGAARALSLQPDQPVAKIVRLRLIDRTPIAIETSLLPLHLFPRLIDEYDEKDSLYRLLTEDYGNGPLRAHDVLEPVLINAFESGILGVPVGAPGILMERTAYGRQDVPIEHTKSIFRGDMCRFSIDLGVDKPHGG